jgi:hypothetical protein
MAGREGEAGYDVIIIGVGIGGLTFDGGLRKYCFL